MSKKVQLSVLVPVYNEEKTIQLVVQKLLDEKLVYEIIIVDDCSQDKTPSILKRIAKEHTKVRVFFHKKNQGKGKAIRTALTYATGNYVLIQDADLEYDPSEIPVLLDPIKKGRADVVFGSRFFGAHTNMFYWHYVGNKLLNFIINIMYNTILSDMETCYKVIPTEQMRSLKLVTNDFRIEPEITCKLLRRGSVILEVPISYVGRTYADGKKITWKDWFKAVETIFSIRIQSKV